MKTGYSGLIAVSALPATTVFVAAAPAAVEDAKYNDLVTAITAGDATVDLRFRQDLTDQEALPEKGDAATLPRSVCD